MHIITEFNILNRLALIVEIKLIYTTINRFIISFKLIFFINLKL